MTSFLPSGGFCAVQPFKVQIINLFLLEQFLFLKNRVTRLHHTVTVEFQERETCPHTYSGDMSFYRKGLSIPGLCNFQGLPCFHPSAVAEGGGLRLTRDLLSLAPGGYLAAFSLGGPHCFLLSCSVHVQKSQGSRVRLRGRSAGSSTLAAPLNQDIGPAVGTGP